MRVSLSRSASFGAKEATFFIINALFLANCGSPQLGSPESFQTQTPDAGKLNGLRNRAVEFIGVNNQKFLGDPMSSFSVTFPENQQSGHKQEVMSGTIFEIKSNLPKNLPLTLALYVPETGDPIPIVLNHVSSDSLRQGAVNDADGTPLNLYGIGALPMDEASFQQVLDGGLTLTPGSFDRYLKKDKNGYTVPLYTLWFKDLNLENVNQFIKEFTNETNPKKQKELLLSHLFGVTFNNTASERALTLLMDGKETRETEQLLEFLVNTFFGPNMVAHAAPAQIPTETLFPTPRPSKEIAPQNTTIKTKFFENSQSGQKMEVRWSVDEQGNPAYWWDERSQDWQSFEPISPSLTMPDLSKAEVFFDNKTGRWKDPYSHLNKSHIPSLVYILSGYQADMNKKEFTVPETVIGVIGHTDFEQWYLEGFDYLGIKVLDVGENFTARNGRRSTAKEYPFQPFKVVDPATGELITPWWTIEINGEIHKILPYVLVFEDPDGAKSYEMLYFIFDRTYDENPYFIEPVSGFDRLTQDFKDGPLVCLPLFQYYPGERSKKVEEWLSYPPEDRVGFYRLLELYFDSYEKWQNMPWAEKAREALKNLIRGELEKPEKRATISHYLYPCALTGVPP